MSKILTLSPGDLELPTSGPSKQKSKRRYPAAKEICDDIYQSGRAREALLSIGMPPESLVDKVETKCPKPGCPSTDSYSMLDVLRGVPHCRHCFNEYTDPKPGDIVATVRWWLDCDEIKAKDRLRPFTRWADGGVDVDVVGGETQPVPKQKFVDDGGDAAQEHLGEEEVDPAVIEGFHKGWTDAKARAEAVSFRLAIKRGALKGVTIDGITRLHGGYAPSKKFFREVFDKNGNKTLEKWTGKALVLPMFNGRGKLRGLQNCEVTNRATPKAGKKVEENSKGFLFYNLELLEKQNIPRLFILEGATDTAAAMSIGLVDCIGKFSAKGGTMHRSLRELCERLQPREIVIIRDGDDAGMEGAQVTALCLHGIAPIKILKPSDYKDFRQWAEAGTTKELINIHADCASCFEPTPGEEKADFSTLLTDDEQEQQEQQADPDKPSAKKLRPLSIGDLIAAYPDLHPPVIHGILRQGETLNLIAASKVGKSFIAGQLAWCVVTGTPWLGHDVEQGRVLILDNELHAATITYRLDVISREMMIHWQDHTSDLHVVPMRGKGIDINGIGERLEAIEPGTYRLVILDALYRTLPEKTSENDNAGMMAIYNRLDYYAEKWACSIAVVHHASKGDQTSKAVTDVGSGAGSISRAADSHITIRPHEDPDLSVMECVARSFKSPEPKSIRFDWPLWSLAETKPVLRRPGRQKDDQQKEADQADAQAILEAIPFLPDSIQQSHLRQRFGFGVAKFDRLMGKLVRGGVVSLDRKTVDGQKQERVFYSRSNVDSGTILN